MSYFKAKIYQIRFRVGPLGELIGPLAGFKVPTSKARKGRGREGERLRMIQGRGRQRKRMGIAHPLFSA